MIARNLRTVVVATLMSHLCMVSMVTTQDAGLCYRTPSNFISKFMEQCNNLNIPNSSCNNAWGNFSSAFARIDPTLVTSSGYSNYFSVLPILSDRDQSLFWSRTTQLVEMISCMCASISIVSSANTPSTAIVTSIDIGTDPEISWCGTTSTISPDGIEYSMRCPCHVSFAFFEEFSRTFARSARGAIFYLGYGEREGGTYGDGSFFAQYELPNLRQSEVTEAVAMVVHRRGHGESCDQGTLINLRRQLESKGIAYSCYDILGDPTNSSEIPALRDCAVAIISSVQNGMEPSWTSSSPISNVCFKNSGASGLQAAAIVMSLVFVTVSITCDIFS